MHTLVLLGELDRTSAPTLEAAIEELHETQVSPITLDLSKLTRIDATGVAVVAFRCRWWNMQGSEISLIPGARPVQRVFELAGMTDRLPFLQGEPAAAATSAIEVAADAAAAHPGQTEQLACEAPSEPRTRSLTLRVSGRRSRARRARRAGLVGGV
ncbi:MAG: STAS domain-containing protein [Solirubrobacteraceae bacterium]